jgi:hypothetical protein
MIRMTHTNVEIDHTIQQDSTLRHQRTGFILLFLVVAAAILIMLTGVSDVVIQRVPTDATSQINGRPAQCNLTHEAFIHLPLRLQREFEDDCGLTGDLQP